MKKCGIITITIGMNYGNRLQNYAMQKVLKDLKYFPETIDYEPSYKKSIEQVSKFEKFKSRLQRCKEMKLLELLKLVKKNTIDKKSLKMKEQYRKECFEKFIQEYIILSKEKYDSESNLNELNKCYSVFITGSDQVWNPYWEGKDEIFYLSFADYKKRIAYAPSFGVSEIPNQQIEFYTKHLTDIPNISVREEKGREIIKKLTNRNAPVVVDPTFLLTKEEWNKISKKTDVKKRYMFTYFLGNLSTKRNKAIKKFAKENNLEIVSMYQTWDTKSNFGGPLEFLGLIENSEYVCTDSFHGAVFSIIYNKPFTVLEREEVKNQKEKKMNSRIETLLRTFRLEECREFLKTDQNKEYLIDFEITNQIIEKLRMQSIEYLKKSLESSEIKNKEEE